jgi:hypothetical protein
MFTLLQVTTRYGGHNGSRANHDNHDNGSPQAQLLRFDARHGLHSFEFIEDRLVLRRFQIIAAAAGMRRRALIGIVATRRLDTVTALIQRPAGRSGRTHSRSSPSGWNGAEWGDGVCVRLRWKVKLLGPLALTWPPSSCLGISLSDILTKPIGHRHSTSDHVSSPMTKSAVFCTASTTPSWPSGCSVHWLLPWLPVQVEGLSAIPWIRG